MVLPFPLRATIAFGQASIGAARLLAPGGPLVRLLEPGGALDRILAQEGALERMLEPGGVLDRLLDRDAAALEPAARRRRPTVVQAEVDDTSADVTLPGMSLL